MRCSPRLYSYDMSVAARKPVNRKAIAAGVLVALPLAAMAGLFYRATTGVYPPTMSLMEAVQQGEYRQVRDHMLTGTSPNERGDDGHSALYTAIHEKKLRIADLLLDHGALIEAENGDLVPPLYAAAEQGNIGLVRRLLDKGAKVKAVYKNGETPLHAAATSGNSELVKLFLDQGADPNAPLKSGSTPLCYAVLSGNSDSVDFLIKRGAKINVRGQNGQTPLHLACLKGNGELINRLLDEGADPDIQDSVGVLPVTLTLNRENGEATFWRLLKETKDVTKPDFRGGNLLHYALRGNVRIEVIQELIRRGCNVNKIDREGSTPFSIAIGEGNEKAEEVLIAAGARVPLQLLIQRSLRNTQPSRSFQAQEE